MPYREIGMLHSMWNSDGVSLSVHYMDYEQRQRYRITIANGLLYTSHGVGLETHGYVHGSFGDYYLFVMAPDGTIYAGNEDDVHHHSSFLAGWPIASAGTIKAAKGKVLALTPQSGHYAPPRDYFDQVLTELRKHKVEIWPNTIRYGRHITTSKKIEKASKSGGGKQLVTDYSPTVPANGLVVGNHRAGQTLRVYPGSTPKWQWY